MELKSGTKTCFKCAQHKEQIKKKRDEITALNQSNCDLRDQLKQERFEKLQLADRLRRRLDIPEVIEEPAVQI